MYSFLQVFATFLGYLTACKSPINIHNFVRLFYVKHLFIIWKFLYIFSILLLLLSCLVFFFLVWQFNKLFAYWCNFFALCIFSFLPMAFLLLNWPKFSATPYIHICSQFLFCISYNCNLVCILFFYLLLKKFMQFFSIKLFYFVFIFLLFFILR